MIDNLRVASPCSADWNKMAGDDRIRHCAECNLNVYNLSAFTEREIRELLAKRQGRFCGRMYQRKDGTVLTENCPMGLRAVTKRVSRIAGAMFSFLAANFMPVAAAAQSYSATNVASAGVAIQVTDPTGVQIPDASVTLHDAARNRDFKGKTDKKGKLTLHAPQGGSYLLTVSVPGFTTSSQGVELRQGEILSLPIAMLNFAITGEIVLVEPTQPPSRTSLPVNTMPSAASGPRPMQR